MSDDLIRRSDAIKAITDISKNYTGKGKRNYHPHIDFLVDALKYDVPTIEPKRGKWLPFEYGDDTWHKCSVCGVADKYRGSAPRPNGEVAEWEYVRNFCPNCGADMRGEDNETD